MPRRSDIHSILVIGSGPIVIGQACEFDYSGNQALRALKEEGFRTILVNSNPATIMTDPNAADAVYIEPLTVEYLKKVIAKEKPDAILPTMGGQTALNLAVKLHDQGVLKENNIELLGANIESINKAENRQDFREAMLEAGLDIPQSFVFRTVAEAKDKEIPFPCILRPSFTLGGEGGGVVQTPEEFEEKLQRALDLSPVNECLVEESLIGWKEYELEVVRDCNDNVIIVCSIENLDPMGVHTGDSITVAPAQTLTDGEYQRMRDQAIKIIRVIGVETGGSNIQFAVDPKTGRCIVIEMNPRVSRSSALASKATGFPIAKVAARLAVGYTLDELQNDITKTTPASFEPTLDYVVVKIPRFDFEKFQQATPFLNTTMKSVGEVMAMGSTFREAFLKALASMENKTTWFEPTKFERQDFTPSARDELKLFLSRPHHRRLFYVVSALRLGLSVEEVFEITFIDPWFLHQLIQIVEIEEDLKSLGSNAIDTLHENPEMLALCKANGFSDLYLAKILDVPEESIRELRHQHEIRPAYRAVDTCAAEFLAHTPYLYSTYGSWRKSSVGPEQIKHEESITKETIMILGGGPNRIGQGIEFDYCCVHAAITLREAGYRVIMINCNPETVSTDADVSDRLYFEAVTAESVIEIAHREKPKGVIVQFGGQTPLKIAHAIDQAGVPIIGTSVDSIDMAEDRKRCEAVAAKLGLEQPANGTAKSIAEAKDTAAKIGYPVLLRPSYVLGGRAMKVVYDEQSLVKFAEEAFHVSEGHPLYIDHYLKDATEVDIDVLSDRETTIVGGLMEHIEEAGVHSGDSFCAIPSFSLSPQICDRIRRAATDLAQEFSVCGLMNAQFAVKGDTVYLIEVNPRASRTVPFVSKSVGAPLAMLAARAMIGEKLSKHDFPRALDESLTQYHVKGPVFPFIRFDRTDTILGPEMRSTGEVMGRAPGFGAAFAKALIATNVPIPAKGKVFISVRDEDKATVLAVVKNLKKNGFTFEATQGTHNYLLNHDIASTPVNKYQEGSPNCVERIKNKEYALVINTTSDEKAVKDSYLIRRISLESATPCMTTVSQAYAFIKALEARSENLDVFALENKYALDMF